MKEFAPFGADLTFKVDTFSEGMWCAGKQSESHKTSLLCKKRSKSARGICLFVCVEVLWPSQPNGVMSSAVSLPNHMFTGQA